MRHIMVEKGKYCDYFGKHVGSWQICRMEVFAVLEPARNPPKTGADLDLYHDCGKMPSFSNAE